MRRILTFLCLLACLCLGACGVREADFFEVFRAGYVAELTGTAYGQEFSARLEMGAATDTGVPPATLTFYAPSTLAGTVLSRAADGSVTLSYGDVSTALPSGAGETLFSLFPTAGAIELAEVCENGHTRVVSGKVEWELLADGTPYAVKTADVTATVVKWQ
ncbi:MAG: hypothetical protein IJW51_05470 [Clostridia bacterium]|nr:hypothetical protein [Clostridia bacterium]